MPVLCLAALAAATLSHPFDHSAWDRVLKAHVNGAGEVDYAAIQRDRRDLDQYIAQLGRSSPANRPELFPSRTAALAYWINAYNAFVTRGVVDHYPTRSVRDLGVLLRVFLAELLHRRRREHDLAVARERHPQDTI